MCEIGRWLAVNGEAIDGTRPWITFGEGPTERSAGQFTDTHRQPFTKEDIRFTTKPGTRYAICLGWPGTEVVIHLLGSGSAVQADNIAEITLLGSSDPPSWTQDERGLTIQMPNQQPCDHAYTLKLTLRDNH